jgi:hypothetical protein
MKILILKYKIKKIGIIKNIFKNFLMLVFIGFSFPFLAVRVPK